MARRYRFVSYNLANMHSCRSSISHTRKDLRGIQRTERFWCLINTPSQHGAGFDMMGCTHVIGLIQVRQQEKEEHQNTWHPSGETRHHMWARTTHLHDDTGPCKHVCGKMPARMHMAYGSMPPMHQHVWTTIVESCEQQHVRLATHHACLNTDGSHACHPTTTCESRTLYFFSPPTLIHQNLPCS